MGKIELYNLVLSILNLAPITEEELEAGTDPIVVTLNGFYGTALRKASREHDWSFLTEEIELEGEDLGPKGGFGHSYALPANLFRLIEADGGRYRTVGATLMTDGSPSILAMTLSDEALANCPADFWDLVAYGMAIFASPRLASGDVKLQTISALYNSILETLKENDVKDSLRLHNSPLDDGWEV